MRLTVPVTDDPTLPTLTFRTWILGSMMCAVLSFLSKFYSYRQNIISFSSTCIQLLLLLIGKLMAKMLPSWIIKVPGTRLTFSMNPGPFCVKEHVLLTILATSGIDSAYATRIIELLKIFYHKNLNFWALLFMTVTTQVTHSNILFEQS